MGSKAMEQYLSRLKRALPCSRPDRERLLSRGQRLLENFLEENPESGYEDLVTAFGPPKIFAGEMLATLDQAALKQTQARRKWLQRGAAILVAVVVVLCSVFWYLRWNKVQGIVDNTFYNVDEGVVDLTEEEFNKLFGITP